MFLGFGLLAGVLVAFLAAPQNRYALIETPHVPFLVKIDQQSGECWAWGQFKEGGVSRSYWQPFRTEQDATMTRVKSGVTE